MLAMPRGCAECGASAGEAHRRSCSFHERYEAAARSPLMEWLASLPAEYERLKEQAAPNAAWNHRFDKAA